MCSFGAVIGRTTPLQLVVMGLSEAVWFWVNFYWSIMKVEAEDIGTLLQTMRTHHVALVGQLQAHVQARAWGGDHDHELTRTHMHPVLRWRHDNPPVW